MSAFNEKIAVKQQPRRSGAIHTSERAAAVAKSLRSRETRGERSLWKALKKLDLEGSHFRRQVPMGPYVVDFVCHAARLIIEGDGGIHQHPAVAQRDAGRRAWLTSRGYSIVAIEDERAANDPHAVADQIAVIVSGCTPAPNPSPQGGGGL